MNSSHCLVFLSHTIYIYTRTHTSINHARVCYTHPKKLVILPFSLSLPLLFAISVFLSS